MRLKSMMVLAALVAALALGAVGTASASAALPEFVLSEGGKWPVAAEYSNAEATSYVENEIQGERYTGNCKGISFKGEISAAKTVSLKSEGKNCEVIKGGSPSFCTSEGEAIGVETMSWSGSPVYIEKSTKKVGILLTLSKTAKIECGGLSVKIKGSIVASVTSAINTKTSKVDFVIHGKSGKPEDTAYENEKGEVEHAKLEMNMGTGYDSSCFEVSNEIQLATSQSLTLSA